MELVLTHAPARPFTRGARCVPPLEEGMLGWVVSQPPVDAGVPEVVQRILVTTLCRLGQVTFLDSRVDLAPGASWSPVPGGLARVLAPGRFRLLRRRPPLPLCCTREPEVALHLFDDPSFSWAQEAQLALLSPAGGPPQLDRLRVEAAFDPGRAGEILGIGASHPFALMLPGPDGDFAHLITHQERAVLLWSQLSGLCAEAGIPLRIVDGPTFSRIRWVAARG